MTDFTTSDFDRLQEANAEIQRFGENLKDRLILLMGIVAPDRKIRRETLSVPRPLETQVVRGKESKGEQFHIRECLGGDRFGTDYREHYLPVKYAFVTPGEADPLEVMATDVARLREMVEV